jgi:hypothetical protein
MLLMLSQVTAYFVTRATSFPQFTLLFVYVLGNAPEGEVPHVHTFALLKTTSVGLANASAVRAIFPWL